MTAAAAGRPAPSSPTNTTDHPPEPTPNQGDAADLIAAVAGLLLVSASLALTAAAIYALLRRRGRRVSLEVVTIALRLSTARTKHQPRTIGRSDVARAQAQLEAHYRAAYVMNAADRLQAALDEAEHRVEVSLPWDASQAAEDDAKAAAAREALAAAARKERAYELAHERARRARLEAAAAVADAADQFGVILGWYTHRDDRTTPECLAAHGSNFRADLPPIIGHPGTLHGGTCRCEAGPPFAGGPTTDEATGFFSRRLA